MSTEPVGPSTGWVALSGQVYGEPDDGYDIDYSWDGEFYKTRGEAICYGALERGSDDFNVGRVEDGALVWFGWMEDHHPDEDGVYAKIAATHGWTV